MCTTAAELQLAPIILLLLIARVFESAPVLLGQVKRSDSGEAMSTCSTHMPKVLPRILWVSW